MSHTVPRPVAKAAHEAVSDFRRSHHAPSGIGSYLSGQWQVFVSIRPQFAPWRGEYMRVAIAEVRS